MIADLVDCGLGANFVFFATGSTRDTNGADRLLAHFDRQGAACRDNLGEELCPRLGSLLKFAAQSPDGIQKARQVFEEVRPFSSHDAEAAYKKDPELVREAAAGRVSRAIRALELETELRIDTSRRADRFVERWQKLDHASRRQYQAGDMSGYKTTRAAMGNMAKSLERDPQLESILANRKKDLGIAFESGRRLGHELAITHGIGLGRGRGLER